MTKTQEKQHIQERQEVSHFPAGDHKAVMNRQDSLTETKYKLQKGSTKENKLPLSSMVVQTESNLKSKSQLIEK